MRDLILAQLIHEDRQREIARDLRVRAMREAREGCRQDTFVPPAEPRRVGRLPRLRTWPLPYPY